MRRKKHRTQADIDERIVRQIDALVGKRKRSQFLERAAIAELRREALKGWEGLRERLRGRGVTMEDYYEARAELEGREE